MMGFEPLSSSSINLSKFPLDKAIEIRLICCSLSDNAGGA